MRVVAIPGAVLFALIVVAVAWVSWPRDTDRARTAIQRGDHATALRLLEPLAGAGEAEAQYLLGGMVARGQGLPRDEAGALEWFRRAASRQHAGAALELGGRYERGAGVEQDLSQAAGWYHKAALNGDTLAFARIKALADGGNAQAQFRLGSMFARGETVPRALFEAVKWFRKAAAGGHHQAAGKIRELAQGGDADAAYHLGRMLSLGEGLDVDPAAAARWIAKAADQGAAPAQYRLGELYGRGVGVPRDERTAARWYLAAADQGHEGAQYALGLMFKQGRGVPLDSAQAVSWMGKAVAGGHRDAITHILEFAGQGNAEAQHRAGLLYFLGRRLDQSNAEAVRWWRMAAVQGHVQAQFDLAYMLAEGQGVPVDKSGAAGWYGRAAAGGFSPAVTRIAELARQGVAAAQYGYGQYLLHGGMPAAQQEIPRDLINRVKLWVSAKAVEPRVEARKWLRRAADQGHAAARQSLEQLR